MDFLQLPRAMLVQRGLCLGTFDADHPPFSDSSPPSARTAAFTRIWSYLWNRLSFLGLSGPTIPSSQGVSGG